MPLAAGTRLGPYEIGAPIGAGGMGEVYRARDTRLNRTVAVKVLARHLSNRPDLTARFEREAQTLASLSHPHICPVFDVGRHDSTDYIVMEHIEGHTLAERLRRGALPPDEALRIAIEVADALDAAHRQGIVHRDLKPGNIMLTKTGAKLLDFGLAKLELVPSAAAAASTLAADPLTAEGTLLGTIQYMAPEQLEGKDADSRTDIFAFGALVHEMITGKRTFEGTSQASLIAAILDRDPPPLTAAQPMTPPLLDRVVRKCLAKNPERRWQAAGDLRDELKWVAEGVAPASETGAPRAARSSRFASMWAMAVTVLLVGALVFIGIGLKRAPATLDEVRFDIATPGVPNLRHVTISPDGRWIAFPALTATRASALFVRRIESTSLEPLAGTEGATAPFWSPDSRYIAFFSGGKIKKVAVSGGPVQNICNAPLNLNAGAWNSAGVVIFAAAGALQRVSSSGGEPVPITTLDESRHEIAHTEPSFLPDGDHFLYLAWSNQEQGRAIYVQSLESPRGTRLFEAQSKARYAAPGYLLFHRGGTLLAQPFDAKKLTLTGAAVRVADEIAYEVLSGEAAFDVSSNQRLVYRAGGGPAMRREFAWFDSTGRREAPLGTAGMYTTNFDLSPDGTQVAVAQRNAQNSQFDIWVLDRARSTPARVTFDPALSANGNVVWSSDGTRIAFSSERRGNRDIFERPSGGGLETVLLATANDEWPEDWSHDGRYLVYGANSERADRYADIYVLPLVGERKPIPITQSPFNEDEPRFSHDVKWLAFNSNESGMTQVYVVSFPALDQKRQISTNGGVQPRFRKDGRELFYLGLDGAMMAVDVGTGPSAVWGTPRPLFNTGLNAESLRDQFAVSADGKRFLIQSPAEGSAAPITVVMNWNSR